MAKPVPHLHRDRHGTFYFRITVAGRTTKKSLRTKDVQLATMRAACLNWELHRMPTPSVADVLKAHQEGRTRKFDLELPSGAKLRNINTDEDNRRAMELIGTLPPEAFKAPASVLPVGAMPSVGAGEIVPMDKGPTVKWVAKQYVDELKAAQLEDTKGIEDKEKTYAAFAAQFDNPKMLMVTKEMATAFKQAALAAPAGASRVNKKIGHMSVLYRWAIDHGQALRDPFDGLRIGTKSKLAKKVQHYDPFSPEDLKKIFSPKTYPAYATDTKPHFHWLPFLLLYTGARPNELASLQVSDVRREKAGSVWVEYFDITEAKSEAGIRKVPLPRAVRDSAFMDYLAERRKEDPSGQLFPLLRPSKNGHIKNVSRRFNENYLAELGITSSKKRLYSFRATFITRMAELNVHPAMLMALVGHYEQDAVDLSSPHFKNYQGMKKSMALRQTIDKFDVKLPMAF